MALKFSIRELKPIPRIMFPALVNHFRDDRHALPFKVVDAGGNPKAAVSEIGLLLGYGISVFQVPAD
jgi:hypothetical protein